MLLYIFKMHYFGLFFNFLSATLVSILVATLVFILAKWNAPFSSCLCCSPPSNPVVVSDGKSSTYLVQPCTTVEVLLVDVTKSHIVTFSFKSKLICKLGSWFCLSSKTIIDPISHVSISNNIVMWKIFNFRSFYRDFVLTLFDMCDAAFFTF